MRGLRLLIALLCFAMPPVVCANPDATTRHLPASLTLDNGVLRLRLDMSAGGAITYLSLSDRDRNIINVHDRGRMVQQSYYAGQTLDRRADGQRAAWSPWAWNPIQVGDVYGNSGTVLDASLTSGVAYTKTLPLLWDMRNEAAQCHMEQWTRLEGNTVHVRNRISCFRDANDIWGGPMPSHQEVPAVYTIADLPYLYTYTGDRPWENEPLTRITKTPGKKFPWEKFRATECWAANVDDTSGSGWGLGVLNPEAERWLGGLHGSPGGGPNKGSTAYISPIQTVRLDRNSVFEYDYTLIVGTLSQIRAYARKHAGARRR